MGCYGLVLGRQVVSRGTFLVLSQYQVKPRQRVPGGVGGVQDLHKARHYLDKLLEIEQAKAPALPKPTRTLGASVPRETP